MKRLTTNKDVSEMSICELAHNSCYAKDRKARYRDYDTDIDARELAIQLLDKYADIPNEFTCDDDFDKYISDYLQYGTDRIEGLIAVFYSNLWAMADLRERLKYYEDLDEQKMLRKFPCKVGDTVYEINRMRNLISEFSVKSIIVSEYGFFIEWKLLSGIYNNLSGFNSSEIGKTVFFTREEAEDALRGSSCQEKEGDY